MLARILFATADVAKVKVRRNIEKFTITTVARDLRFSHVFMKYKTELMSKLCGAQ